MNRLSIAKLLASCLLALAVSSQTAAQTPPRPDLYMLAVGIDRYQPPTNNLNGCVNDALGLAKLFQGQAGKLFDHVDAQVLTDGDATQQKIAAGLQTLRAKGKPGDWYAIVLSGHGGMGLHRWGFTAHDRGDVSDATLLEIADSLATAGKKVLLIIDACYAGQLRFAAHPLLNRHREPSKGGIVLMISSMPSQTSAALFHYSAFARAVEEGLAGSADYDQNQQITLQELRRFTYNRVYELRLKRVAIPGLAVDGQDCVIDASISFPENTVLAHAHQPPLPKVDDDGPSASRSELFGGWMATVKFPPDVPNPGTATYRLKLENNGAFRASLSAGGKIVASGEGIYTMTAKTLRLHHKQAVDRLEVTAATSAAFASRFQGKEFSLRRDVVPKGHVLLDVAARLMPSDPPDRVRTSSPHKVHEVKLMAGIDYAIDLRSSEFDPFVRIENSAGEELASDDDGGEDLNARIIFTPPKSETYRIIVTAFQGGSGNFQLRVESSVAPPVDIARMPVAAGEGLERLELGAGGVSVTDKITERDAQDGPDATGRASPC